MQRCNSATALISESDLQIAERFFPSLFDIMAVCTETLLRSMLSNVLVWTYL